MAQEPLSQFLETILNKFKDNSCYINNPDNVVIGSYRYGIETLPDEDFPRIEGLINKLKFDGFVDQRIMDQGFRFSFVGHIRRPKDETSPADMDKAIGWAREINKLTYSVHDDKISGNPPCDGFIQMSGYPECFIEYEMFPQITTIIYVCEAEIQLPDTYTNNP